MVPLCFRCSLSVSVVRCSGSSLVRSSLVAPCDTLARDAALPAHRVAGLYLAQRVRFGMKFGLETMRALVEEMGHPERAYPSLLIAGTNGKGSVAAYCDAVLRASGLRTGRYTSPHLVHVRERITVDGREISTRDFARAVRAVRDAATRLVRRGVLARTRPSSRC